MGLLYLFYIDKRPEERCPTSQCETVPTEAEEHTTCPTCPERDCTCPNAEVTTECPTPGTDSTENKTNTDRGREASLETTVNIERGRDEQQKAEPVTCLGVGGGLGALAAVQMVILVGVVLGWVWSCHRNKIK